MGVEARGVTQFRQGLAVGQRGLQLLGRDTERLGHQGRPVDSVAQGVLAQHQVGLLLGDVAGGDGIGQVGGHSLAAGGLEAFEGDPQPVSYTPLTLPARDLV